MKTNVAEKTVSTHSTSTSQRAKLKWIELRARTPLVLRYAAVTVLALTLVAIGVGYYRSRTNQDFRMRGGAPQLSNEIESVIYGYERRVTEGDQVKLLVKADKETIFADKRHELENVFLENYSDGASAPDRIRAQRAVYTPDSAQPDVFTVDFSGAVEFLTRDGLRVVTEQVKYDRAREVVEADGALRFERENMTGSAVGATLDVGAKRLTLNNSVELQVLPNGAAARGSSLTDFGRSTFNLRAQTASFDQDLARLETNGAVTIRIEPNAPNPENPPVALRAEQAIYNKGRDEIELNGNVDISAGDNSQAAGNARAAAAVYRRPAREFVLRERAEIIFVNANSAVKPTTARAASAFYSEKTGKIELSGEASVEQDYEQMRADRIVGTLAPSRRLQNLNLDGNAFLRSDSGARATELRGGEIGFEFDDHQQLQLATATGGVAVVSANRENAIRLSRASEARVRFEPKAGGSLMRQLTLFGNTEVALEPKQSADYSAINFVAPNQTEVFFRAQDGRSLVKELRTGGRTTITLNAPRGGGDPKAANKRLAADALRLLWNAAGQDLQAAEAIGNAELHVEPINSRPGSERQRIYAGRFECGFHETGNLARNCTAVEKARAQMETIGGSTKNISAERLTAHFGTKGGEVERVEAAGGARFSESDRNAAAATFAYSNDDGIVRLRGGEPTVWDNQARLKAMEADWDTRREISTLRGRVTTTYYSQANTGGAAPFANAKSPVFLASDAAEFNHRTGTAVYTGGARAWQDNNYVRAERLILQRDERAMSGEGRVQSALYSAARRGAGAAAKTPVFAQAEKIVYRDADKTLRYTGNVDIRGGTERITGGSAEVLMNSGNDVVRTLVQTEVVVTQPGRRAVGDWAQYVTADETIVLRGKPARIEDAEQGISEAGQIVVSLREKTVVGSGGGGTVAPGRVRSTHKIRKP